ncbi:MAG: LysM peptidoglycan-binding domain-containing protein [Spirochaetes bacterium]|nr:LysM peptidoglycan-binding domain-containing protein [Spirochaetota bacterium]
MRTIKGSTMNFTALCAAVMIIAAAGLSATSTLLYDAPPHVLAVGKCYDILDARTPATRTYSGALGSRDKMEVFFFHNAVVEDIAAENIMFGMKSDFVKGLRFGAYGTYLSYGAFEDRNERSVVINNISPGEFVVGVPVTFCAKSLNLVNEGTNKNGMIDFLNAFNAGININYFQSMIGDSTARSVFADVNLAYKLEAPYVGMPEKLISEDDVEKERAQKAAAIEAEMNARIAGLKENKTLKPDAIAEKDKEYQALKASLTLELNQRYTKKKEDVRAMYVSREKMFEFTRDAKREIDAAYVSEFLGKVNGEVNQLIGIASNTVRENTEALKKITAADIDNNTADIDFYRKKLEKYTQNADLMKKVDGIIKIYQDYLAGSGNDDSRKGYRDYKIVTNDTWQSIALKQLGAETKAPAIISYNNVKADAKPEAGKIIRIPLESAGSPRQEKVQQFALSVGTAKADIAKVKLESIEQLLYDKVLKTLDKRVALFEYRDMIDVEADAKYMDLRNLLTEQQKALSTREADLNRELKKIKLKKELDFLNSTAQNDRDESVKEYKRKERTLFMDLLRGIYKAKHDVIVQLRTETTAKGVRQLADIDALYAKKNDLSFEDMTIAKFVVKDDKAKVERLEASYAREIEQNSIAKADAVTSAKKQTGNMVEDFNWQLYMTELIYLSSDEKKNTLAFGLYARNLGLPYSYGGTVSDLLPMTFGFDLNYNVLSMENNLTMLYLHSGYSSLENLSVGFGAMHRIFDTIEFRAGTYIDSMADAKNMKMNVSGGLGFLLDVGLMNYRIDGAVKYEDVFGLTYTIAIQIVF